MYFKNEMLLTEDEEKDVAIGILITHFFFAIRSCTADGVILMARTMNIQISSGKLKCRLNAKIKRREKKKVTAADKIEQIN